jgi:Rps23 Pro-64 3,4-dihydroxylase Tpa1-like proline 4-hydroxylase
MPLSFHDCVDHEGRRILVIDNAIDVKIAQDLFDYIHEYAAWGLNSHEAKNADDKINDNVPFIHAFNPNLFAYSPLWAEHLEVCLRSFWGDGYVPYDCSVNNLRFGDNPLDHRDSFDSEIGDVTMLLYLNPTWNISHAGETVFFSEANEIKFSILPKFCRIVLFDSYINHIARPPTRLFHGTRYTLAVKLRRAKDEGMALNKRPVIPFSRQLRLTYFKKTLFG